MYQQFCQVPLLFICLGHFGSFFNTRSANHSAYFTLREIDGINTKITQNKIWRFVAPNVELLAHSLSDIVFKLINYSCTDDSISLHQLSQVHVF